MTAHPPATHPAPEPHVERAIREALQNEYLTCRDHVANGTATSETAQRLFRAFARGLAKSAEIMGLSLDIEADLDRLTFELQATVIGSGFANEPRERRCDVLIAEDSQDIRELWTAILEKRGYAVRAAGDGPSAVEQAIAYRPRVLLVDIQLPGIDGYDVARETRNRLGGGVYIIAVTGYGEAEDRKRALEAGFDDHMVKPLDLVKLERLLSSLTR